MIQISFHGAMSTVGCSAILIDTGIEKLVLDYGVKPREIPPKFPIPIKGRVDAVLLSHAHLDHSGALALFFIKGNSTKIYAIDVSKPLTELLLLDSIKISREEGVELPFSKLDVRNTLRNFVDVEYRKSFRLHEAEITFYDAGHIPGSASILVETQGKRIFYTGDIKTSNTRLLKKADLNLKDIDYLITESTYADREHLDRKEQEKELVRLIEEALSRNGIALVACFAVGRAQEVLLILDKYGIDYPLYMDGMAKKATTIINSHSHRLRDSKSLDKALEKVEYVKNQRMRKKIIKHPCVILTTSGMLQGGPIVWYLKKLHRDTRSSLILTGWQLEETPGKILLETGRYINQKEGLDFEVKMNVKRLDFSAHAGRSELFELVEKISPEKVFCVHGDHTEEFAFELRERGFDAVAPLANNRVFEIP